MASTMLCRWRNRPIGCRSSRAIAVVELVLLTVAMLMGMLMQTIAGYHHYEVLQYVKELT